MRLGEYHAKFPGGIRWRVTLQGVELEGKGLLSYDAALHQTASSFLSSHADDCANASREFDVPVELLAACALTQSHGGREKFVWRDPGYVGDGITPELISAGACRMLVSSARFFLKDPEIDHHWMLNVGNALRACAACLRFHRATVRTGWDPVLVACAFNAGGLYEDPNPDNYWRLRQYSMLLGFHSRMEILVPDRSYADLFSRYFSAARELVDAGMLDGRKFTGFRTLVT